MRLLERFENMEATSSKRLHPMSTMEERKEVIRMKYMDKAFVQPFCNTASELYSELESAIANHSIEDLLQCVGECPHLEVEITDPLPSSVSGEAEFYIRLR